MLRVMSIGTRAGLFKAGLRYLRVTAKCEFSRHIVNTLSFNGDSCAVSAVFFTFVVGFHVHGKTYGKSCIFTVA